MIEILNNIAWLIGVGVLVVAVLAIVSMLWGVVDMLRARFPKLDLWLYDDVGRFNRRYR